MIKGCGLILDLGKFLEPLDCLGTQIACPQYLFNLRSDLSGVSDSRCFRAT